VPEEGLGERPSSPVGYGIGVPEVPPDLAIAIALLSRRLAPRRQAALQGLGDFPWLGRVNSAHRAAASGWDAHVAGSSPLRGNVPGFPGVLSCLRPARSMTKSSPASQWGAGSRKGNWDQCGSQCWLWALLGFALSPGFLSLVCAVPPPGLDPPSPTTGICKAPHCKCVLRHRDALPWSWAVAG